MKEQIGGISAACAMETIRAMPDGIAITTAQMPCNLDRAAWAWRLNALAKAGLIDKQLKFVEADLECGNGLVYRRSQKSAYYMISTAQRLAIHAMFGVQDVGPAKPVAANWHGVASAMRIPINPSPIGGARVVSGRAAL